MKIRECEECGSETEFLYFTSQGWVCFDCMTKLDDEEDE